MNPREKLFFNFYKSQSGIELMDQPARFPLTLNGKLTSYRPDFHCQVTDKFYEVIGTRQAWHQNRTKVLAFRKQWPTVALFVVHPNGDSYKEKGNDRRDFNIHIRLNEFEKKCLNDLVRSQRRKSSELIRQLIREAKERAAQ